MVLRVATIPGDGIGPEVTGAAVEVLSTVLREAGHELQVTEFDFGADRYLRDGHVLDEADVAALSQFDSIILGAIGDPRVKPGILERGLLLKLRFDFDQYVNLRPAKHFPGVASPLADPEGIDFVVVREGTEGLYVGNGGKMRVGTEHEVATEVSVNTAFAVRRVVRYAFNLAQSRPAKKLTLVHKTNVLVHAGSLWDRVVEEVAKDYPDIAVEYQHVDAATIHLLTRPQSFDVIVTDNLFGDIITDEAGAITGGIGLAASGNINPEGNFPSMFEPVHGSAPDIVGQGIADPIAAIGSIELLLRSRDLAEEADRVAAAIDADMRWRAENPVEAANRSTQQITEAVMAALGQ